MIFLLGKTLSGSCFRVNRSVCVCSESVLNMKDGGGRMDASLGQRTFGVNTETKENLKKKNSRN